ncbi:Rpn family recombination-promoting nuclease/putative transposase [Alicyclobacillus dauci]|uniref:Rpn family recombination-promoting nuclease/putative transposase n=2 Tax=Alicyclobacillus dauci TaxID=1475485 RepID=A0ABY6ZAQ0_9BACL|nr:Rpn family recombination-promoting nuclease/putative transposase [Alicyclobacillus dauci]
MELLKPKIDFVFKRIFGTEENQDILLDFVNSVFESAGEPQVLSVDILNPYIDKGAVRDKQSILDIRARGADGQYINVEIQLWNRKDIEKRTLFYWAKMYSGQLEEGDPYRKLSKTVTINILDFDYIHAEKYHTTFHLREDSTSLMLTDDIEIHFIELRKLKEQSYGTQRRLVRWMLFIAGLSNEKLEELAMEEPVIRKALTTLEFLSQDAEARRLYEERQRALRDEISAVEGAREEGREEGRLEVARNLLTMGLSVVEIAKATGLPEEDILKLQKPN